MLTPSNSGSVQRHLDRREIPRSGVRSEGEFTSRLDSSRLGPKHKLCRPALRFALVDLLGRIDPHESMQSIRRRKAAQRIWLQPAVARAHGIDGEICLLLLSVYRTAFQAVDLWRIVAARLPDNQAAHADDARLGKIHIDIPRAEGVDISRAIVHRDAPRVMTRGELTIAFPRQAAPIP